MAVAVVNEPGRGLPRGWVVAGLALSILLGAAVGVFPLFAFLFIALAVVIISVISLERLAILFFWTLPYMVANLPTGSFTLKLPEVFGYLFATAFFARALIRKEKVALPPATLQLICYLGALALAAALAPNIPGPFMGKIASTDRNSPTLRPLSIIIWIGLSWMVVIALYNLVGSQPKLLWKCARAHVLSGGLAAAISLIIYVLALRGFRVVNVASGDLGRNLVTDSGEGLRLAGVAYEPLFLAFYLQTVIPITAVAMLAYPKWIPRWVCAVSLLAQVMAMLLTVSSGGWAGALLALALLIPARLISRIPRRARIGILAGTMVVLGMALMVAVAQQSFTTIATNAAGKILGGGDRVRQAEWTAGYRMFAARPLTGFGPGLTSYHFPEYHPGMWSMVLSGLPEVNNLYLNELASSGIIGFALFGLLLLKGVTVPLRQLVRWRPYRVPILTALSASLVGCLVQYMSLNPLSLIYFCAVVGLTYAAARAAEAGELEPT